MKNIIILFLLLAASVQLHAQNSDNVQEFAITIDQQGDELSLTCTEGCAWTTLSFDTGSTKVVSSQGVRSTDEGRSMLNTKPTFAFKVTKTADGLHFASISGTTWSELTCSLDANHVQVIDHSGIKQRSR